MTVVIYKIIKVLKHDIYCSQFDNSRWQLNFIIYFQRSEIRTEKKKVDKTNQKRVNSPTTSRDEEDFDRIFSDKKKFETSLIFFSHPRNCSEQKFEHFREMKCKLSSSIRK